MVSWEQCICLMYGDQKNKWITIIVGKGVQKMICWFN